MNTKEISDNVNSISLDEAALADHGKICEIWPVVKEGLELLKSLIKNIALKGIIDTIIAVGDAIIGKICK